MKNARQTRSSDRQPQPLSLHAVVPLFPTHDPTRDLRQLGCPVLVLNGSKDIQVDPNLNVPAIREAL
ncbi:MAG: hypothetical protein R3C56_29825 [Pirellulaceae bacterium]